MNAWRITFAAVVALVVVYCTGCIDAGPAASGPNLGNATVVRYVAIGNSLTSGYQSNGLYKSAQDYSFPNLIAGQLRLAGANIGTFEQPYYSDPGTPGADGKASRYEIISLVGPVIGPRGLTPGVPTNTALSRPYDNLGIPGAVVFDFLDTASFTSKALPPRSNPLFSLILRNAAFGRNILSQARRLSPDLVTFWLGNNDVLGYATSGGASPSSPTPSTAFAALFAQALDSLRAALPTAKIVVANIPDVTAIPFFTTLGPKIRPSLPAGVTLKFQNHGETGPGTGSTSLTDNSVLICLTGSTYAAYLGKPGGKWYRDKAYPALPPGIDTNQVFGFHPQNPWPDALVLDPAEITTATNTIAAFNQTIAAIGAAKNAALVDINTFFNGVKANGYSWAGQKYTADYVSGGIFSLDGVHPSSRGAGILANQFIKAMNEKFGMNVTYVDLGAIPGIPAPLAKTTTGIPVIPPEAFSELEMLWGAR
ncbi:MAG: SGNH/GDSL hydrolase family protein [Bacteroidota bacterium]